MYFEVLILSPLSGSKDRSMMLATPLQLKVIMLPIIAGSKACLFAPRLIAYNESFANVNKNIGDKKTFAVLWHEGIAGRKAADVASTFWAFLRANRDARAITIWMDNCSAQNKNYSLMSCMIHAVNRADCANEEITFKYFVTGHTFMSADAFHASVERSLKKRNNIYEFTDFVDAVGAAQFGRVIPLYMVAQDFRCWSKKEFDESRIKRTKPAFVLRVFSRPLKRYLTLTIP